MRRLLGLVPVVLIVVSGCGSGDAPTTPPPEPTTSVVETSTPAVAPLPNAAALPAAADGTNFAACSDGVCEVLIAPGDKIGFTGDVVGFELLTVEAVDAEGVDVLGTGPGIELRLGEQTPGTPYTMNRLVMSIVGFTSGQAVMKMAPV